jgi:hypothetical protein
MTDLTTPRVEIKKARKLKCFHVVFTVQSSDADAFFPSLVCLLLASLAAAQFIRGKSTAAEVQSTFGRFRRVEQLCDGFIGYYEIQVYNPFEDSWGRGRR